MHTVLIREYCLTDRPHMQSVMPIKACRQCQCVALSGWLNMQMGEKSKPKNNYFDLSSLVPLFKSLPINAHKCALFFQFSSLSKSLDINSAITKCPVRAVSLSGYHFQCGQGEIIGNIKDIYVLPFS